MWKSWALMIAWQLHWGLLIVSTFRIWLGTHVVVFQGYTWLGSPFKPVFNAQLRPCARVKDSQGRLQSKYRRYGHLTTRGAVLLGSSFLLSVLPFRYFQCHEKLLGHLLIARQRQQFAMLSTTLRYSSTPLRDVKRTHLAIRISDEGAFSRKGG